VLLADDDARSAFALASVLERNGVEVLFAENGREALETLHANPEVDLVLMDVMMPELDGYETMRLIRAENRFAELPIISLTAKAMKGDREKSIESGASDYLTKPVDPEQVMTRLQVWLEPR
jgi:CheY-like chemotaxis protein